MCASQVNAAVGQTHRETQERMSSNASDASWMVLASVVNLALAALLLFTAMHPPRLYGGHSVSGDVGYGVLSVVPMVNLVALGLARRPKHAVQIFTGVVSWANRGGAALGVLFGAASCLERSYSRPEIIATAVLFIPPSVTAVALWVLRRPRGVSSTE